MTKLINSFVDYSVSILSSYGIFAGFFLIILESIIPMLPLSVFIALNIQSYGNIIGYIISLIATIIGCSLSFFLFRFLFQKKLYKIVEKKKMERINNIIDTLSNISISNLALLMAIPFSPASLINVASALSNVSYKKFFVSMLIGKTIMVYFWAYIGTSLLESFTDINVLFKIGILLTISYLLSGFVQKKLNIK